jgi:hypothetical protein
MSDWRTYERFVARLIFEQVSPDLTVIPNARLKGRFSGIERQIDALIDSRHHDDISKRVIVDAKQHKRRIDIKHVEEFEGMMKDVGADHGILVCPNGHTSAALRRAQDAITIKLLPLDLLESCDLTTWDPCRHTSCNGLLLWDANPALCIGGLWTIFATAKCDKCRRFNVWCWDCKERFALDDEDEHHCRCNSCWFWITAVEDDSEDETERLNSVYLLLVLADGNHVVVDRRPLR